MHIHGHSCTHTCTLAHTCARTHASAWSHVRMRLHYERYICTVDKLLCVRLTGHPFKQTFLCPSYPHSPLSFLLSALLSPSLPLLFQFSPLLQFNRYEPNDEGRISERQFAKMILSYADFTHQEKKKYLKRLKVAFKQEDLVSLKCWRGSYIDGKVLSCLFNA